MAITVTNRLGSWSGTDASSYDWSLSGLTTGRWLVIDLWTEQPYPPGGYPTHNTPSGGSLAYAQEQTIADEFTRRLTRWVAWNPDQTSFTLTTTTSSTQMAAMIVVNEIDGADTSDVFVTSYTASGSGTSGTVTMGGYSDSGNRYLFTVALSDWGGTGNVAPEGTELADTYISSGGGGHIESQWHATTQDTTPSASWTSTTAWRCIASEIKVSGAGGAAAIFDPLGMSGFFGA